MRYASDVYLDNMETSLVPALTQATLWASENGDVTVTSIGGKEHGAKSLHYDGAAVDFDAGNVDRNKALATFLLSSLPSSFDVVNETSHVHVEHQPKRSTPHA